MNRAVFLDRDGVINKALMIKGVPSPPKNLMEVEILMGVKEATELLSDRGYKLVVVTNQPDVARGDATKETVESINEYLLKVLGIKHWYVCFHDDKDECKCRKPMPGLLHAAAKDLSIDVGKSFMVGDRWRDIAAGQAAGCGCYFVDNGYSEASPTPPYTRVSSLIEATKLILENSNDSFS